MKQGRGWGFNPLDTKALIVPCKTQHSFYASAPKVPEALCFRVVRPSVRPYVRPSVRPSVRTSVRTSR